MDEDNSKIDEILEDSEDTQYISLSSKSSRKLTQWMIIFWLGNFMLLLYSHIGISAVIKSTFCPSSFDNCPDQRVGFDENTKDQCTNVHDSTILTPGLDAHDDLAIYLADFGFDCFLDINPDCVADSLI